MPILAYIFSVMFYVLLALAALTSTISLHEVVTAFLHEEFNLTRGRAARLVTFGCIIIGVISSLSLGVMQKYTLFDKGFFDLLDLSLQNNASFGWLAGMYLCRMVFETFRFL